LISNSKQENGKQLKKYIFWEEARVECFKEGRPISAQDAWIAAVGRVADFYRRSGISRLMLAVGSPCPEDRQKIYSTPPG